MGSGAVIRDAQRKNITFHDLRATGITWMAVRGDDPLRIKQRAGHKSFSTTEGYIREAENLSVGFGKPFPSLPAELTGIFGFDSGFMVSSSLLSTRNSTNQEWSKGGSNP
ncbi:site-specific integrase [Pendulispora albinea]|uniref:Site-specific integrase n=1 Tax=Pendulispora albinea TaxID=2741071 RepID=A0ABZ2M4U8_9BACT